MIDPELLVKNEFDVNRQTKKIYWIFALVAVVSCIFVILTDGEEYRLLNIADSVFLILLFIIMGGLNRIIPSESSAYKYVFMGWFFIPLITEAILSPDYFWPAFAIPIILSCRYYNTKLVGLVSVITQVAMVVANWGCAYIRPMLGYVRAGSMRFPKDVTIVGDGRWMSEIAAELIQDGTVSRFDYMWTHYWSYVVYMAVIMASISGICYLVTRHEIRTLEQQSVVLEEKHKLDVKLADSKYKTLVSQIQPHFIFNVLNSAIALCSYDPEQAEEMLVAFSGYLRHDIDSLSQDGLITLDSEMNSVKNYLKLEQMRFGDRVKVAWDLKTTGILIPPLTLQPIVENAVKHGICKKPGGGTIKISSREEESEYQIMIEDDGVGFDPEAIKEDDEQHVGVSNVQARLRTRMGARMKIDSSIGEGTHVTIYIPKKIQEDMNKSL